MTKLKKIRISKRLKLREVADSMKITPQSVFKMEKIGILTVPAAKRYAKALGVTWQEVIEG